MADTAKYPQIPSTVWWGIRSMLNKTPSATFDERTLSIQLNVQPVAAKQYISELVAVGLLNEERRATPLALKWRLDAQYSEAVDQLVGNAYPESLRTVAPPDEGDRQKAISWFQQEGLGEGAAKNKAATYMMIGSPLPSESPAKSQKNPASKPEAKAGSSAPPKPKPATAVKNATSIRQREANTVSMPLNINVQIHVSADASTDQIETIFSAMKRYLYDQQDN